MYVCVYRLESLDVLRLELGRAFSFEGNPLLLASPQVCTTAPQVARGLGPSVTDCSVMCAIADP